MDSSETDKATIFPNSSDSVPVQDSPIFSYISNLSPIKPFKAAPVAQGFPGLNSPPLVFTSPRINSQHPSSSLTRPQFLRSSSDELRQRHDDKENNTGRAIYESGKPNTQFSSELNFCTDKVNDNNGSEHDVYEYLADPLEVDCGDSGQLANLSLKHSNDALHSSKESVGYNKDDIAKDVKKAVGVSPDILEQGKEDCRAKSLSTLKPVETDSKKRSGDMSIGLSADHASEEQQKENSNPKNAGCKFESISTSQLQESLPLAQEFKYCSDTTVVISSGQDMMLHDSKNVVPMLCENLTALQRECIMCWPKHPKHDSFSFLPCCLNCWQIATFYRTLALPPPHPDVASLPLFSMRRRCLQFEEVHQKIVTNSPSSCNQSVAASDSRSPASPVDAEVLESSYANIPAAPSSTQLENMKKSVFSMFPAQNFANSSLAVSKPAGIGLHLNSIVSVMPMGCGASASIKSAEEGYLSVQGKKSVCITSCHLTENASNSSTSFNVVENLPVTAEEIKHNIHASMLASLANPSSHSLKPLYNPELLTKPTDDHATPSDKRKSISEYAECLEEFTRSNPGKKRKKSNDGDGCKRCNCKKTKCLKLYCDCFAAGIYCAEPCSCQGCFNRPEYEDTVLETRQQIESRNPLAFAPKLVQRVIELPANSTQEDINHSTPSSARHKRGCNCKKSMCLKKYCECYQSNVGCSDGCWCEGCKNVYGKKEEYSFSKDNVSIAATNERSDTAFDERPSMVATRNGFLQTELCKPHNLTPSTPLIQCSDRGKDALKSGVPFGRFLPSTKSDLPFSAPHGNLPGSPRCSDNHDVIKETSTGILDLISSDQEAYYGNSERVDDFSTQGLRDINPFIIQQNPPAMSISSSVTPTPRVWTNGSSAQLCNGSGPFSSVNSLRWRSSSITPMVLFGETKLPRILDSDNGLYNIIEDDGAPEILKENPTPITAVKVSSPNKKRVSPPHSSLHELGSSSSVGLRSGCKFILKAVPSFPPLTPCIDVKDTISRSTTDLDSSNSK